MPKLALLSDKVLSAIMQEISEDKDGPTLKDCKLAAETCVRQSNQTWHIVQVIGTCKPKKKSK